MTWDEDDAPQFPGVHLAVNVPEPAVEVAGQILGPDGEVLAEMLSRPWMPVGYAALPKEPFLWVEYE